MDHNTRWQLLELDDFSQLLQNSKMLETSFQNLEGLVTQSNLFCWLYIAEMVRVYGCQFCISKEIQYDICVWC